ncbi:MAG: TatD family hydrolase, partial [Bdellovibrionales bacterium]|nr:TatD family hydrolase [Bdellovibrionales bacterium]
SRWLAEECLKLGMDISFSGVLSFKNADDLREVCRVVPLDRLHVETDAPFLAPVPKRGKKNEPAFMVHTAQEVANLKQVTMEELSRQTKLNALRVFPKLDWP